MIKIFAVASASSEVLQTMIRLAMYDTTIAIEGGYEPYAADTSAPPGADVRAAVATAAYRTGRQISIQSKNTTHQL